MERKKKKKSREKMHNQKVKHWSNDAISLNLPASVHPCHKAFPPRHPFPPTKIPKEPENSPFSACSMPRCCLVVAV